MRRTVLLGLALVVASAACSSSDQVAPTGDTGPGSTTTTATATTADGGTTTLAGSTTTVTYPSNADDLGVGTIEQLTPISGGGTRPLLEWAPVDGADRYFVLVSAPSGVIYWGWRTSDTSVPVGGYPQLNEGAAGPAVSEGMTWTVTAVDADGRIIAVSPHRPIAP